MVDAAMSNRCEQFARRFVMRQRFDRFCHEFRKKPMKLNSRVCHEPINELFRMDALHREPPTTVDPEQLVWVVSGSNRVKQKRWSEFARTEMGRGDGVLVMSERGDFGYLETEAVKGAPSGAWYIYQ